MVGVHSVASAVEVALLDSDGVIVAVNPAWEEFARANDGDPTRAGVGSSYLGICQDAAAEDESAALVLEALTAALAGELPAPVTVPIPCDSPDQPRWFDVLVSSRFEPDGRCAGATVTLTLLSHARAEATPGRPDAPRQEMERLVGELSERTQNVLRLQGRMRRLVLATSTLAAEPGLPDVLDRVATFAVELTGAGSVTVHRHDDPIPQSDEPALAIAIRVGGEDFATIRLSNQPNGQFSADDRWLAEQLAAIAGIAIEHLLLRESVGQ